MSEFPEKVTLELIQQAIDIKRYNKIDWYYPDAGPLRRELYPKHLEFFGAGLEHRERLMLAANRTGKTEGIGAYETTKHLTGDYPDWWEGRRFENPIHAWCAGVTAKKTQEIQQLKLLGPINDIGSGILPRNTILKKTPKSGIRDAIESVYVRHKTGGVSVLTFKSFEQGPEVFQGNEVELIWLDEEPPLAVYTECLMRTMITPNNPGGGIVLLTFTPLKGLSEVVLQFLPGGKIAA